MDRSLRALTAIKTIALCGSMRSLYWFKKWKTRLERMGFTVITPRLVDERRVRQTKQEMLAAKKSDSLSHFLNIERSDAILVLNYKQGNKSNYIGGATFAEIAVAFYLGKKVFLVNPIPEDAFYEEELETWGVHRWNRFKELANEQEL